MKAINFIERTDVFLPSLRKVGDLENFGLPLLSLFCDTMTSKLYLSLRSDQDGEVVRWVFVEASKSSIIDYIDEKVDLRTIVLKNKDRESYYVDQYVNQSGKVTTYKLASFPIEYLPVGNALFDVDGCSSYYTILDFLSHTHVECNL